MVNMMQNLNYMLPLGNSGFDSLREDKQIYVDKTDLIYELASVKGYYFLSRPRRFGKTLLVSTFESLFKDSLKNFKDLAIESKWQDTTYPVIHLDFTACRNFRNIDVFKRKFFTMVEKAFKRAGFNSDAPQEEDSVAEFFDDMLSSLDQSNFVVLLIDEYDAPLNNCLHNPELFEDVQEELFDFYDKIKKFSPCFRFMFITGICRYKNLGIFSGMNFMTDISLSPKYGTLLGYTEDELRKYFKPYIERASEVLGLSFEDVLKTMALHYDGYCFDEKASTHVFTPWSVLNFLATPEDGFKNYWYDSAGRPTVLLNYIKTHSLKDPSAYGQEQNISIDSLNSSQSIQKLEDLALLTQAGYLTIKEVLRGGILTLNYPNLEVSNSMRKLYNEVLFGEDISTLVHGSAYSIFARSTPYEIFTKLNCLFGRLDYQRFPVKDEATLKGYLQLYLDTGGIDDVQVEKHNAYGRSDLEFSAEDRYFVLELKFAKKASDEKRLLKEAIQQIKEHHYGEQKEHTKLIRLALVFSGSKRMFTDFAVVE